MKTIGFIKANIRQFAVFILIGLLSALVDIGLLQLLIHFGYSPYWSTTVGFFVGFIVNFILHQNVTFSAQWGINTILKFTLVVLINYVLTLILIKFTLFWVSQILIGKILSLPIVAINGFVLSKYWIFKDGIRTNHL
ncbi:MAG: GtrA family protein [Candidatus Pacebacteria bacterium]|nr:GtrA family protein [Candidatus Paceibacterota bacterium]